MSKHGELTAEIGAKLTLDGYDIFYDHGASSENVGKIVSTLKEDYGREDELSQLDNAVVEHDSDKTILLVEIEETSDKPKSLLGDVFGVLFGKYIYFKRRNLQVGEFTTLLIAGISKAGHPGRNRHIQHYANNIKAGLKTKNSKIGKVAIKIYRDEKDILENLPTLLEMMVS